MSDFTEADIRPLHEIEREMVARALAVTGGNTRRAAGLLGVSTKTVYNLVATYGITRPPQRLRSVHRIARITAECAGCPQCGGPLDVPAEIAS